MITYRISPPSLHANIHTPASTDGVPEEIGLPAMCHG